MAYNKAKEEKKWRLWKEAEENKLRSLGVDEDTIEKLRVYDWEVFNSDRRFYQRLKDVATYLEEMEADAELPEIRSVDDLLNSIENQKLHQALIMVDKLTLQIALWKVNMRFFTRKILHWRGHSFTESIHSSMWMAQPFRTVSLTPKTLFGTAAISLLLTVSSEGNTWAGTRTA